MLNKVLKNPINHPEKKTFQTAYFQHSLRDQNWENKHLGILYSPVLRIRIRIRIRIHGIHMFLGLPDPDPDPLVRGMDPEWIRIRILLWIRIRILLSSCKNCKRILDSYYFVTLFDFLSLKNDVNVASKSNKQKKIL